MPFVHANNCEIYGTAFLKLGSHLKSFSFISVLEFQQQHGSLMREHLALMIMLKIHPHIHRCYLDDWQRAS